ncbi:NUDIX hydrolase [Haloarchaeobius sp. HRN-SO-5]|uniref:NUDIX hydrolase n=1 Tax=Haloarchaeobius sp. HRN-SO-5 TaxID=3446118 RepID=UPI003EC0B5A4
MHDASTTDDPATTDSTVDVPADPTELAARPGVEATTDSFPHGDEDHCEADYAGRAIVGVTNDAGELLLVVDRDAGRAVLPSPKVEYDGDWTATAREEVAEVAGLDVRITGVERVRHAEHVLEGDDEVFDETTHVVFAAEPTADDPELADRTDGAWAVEWHDSYPADLFDDDSAEAEDVRSFVD